MGTSGWVLTDFPFGFLYCYQYLSERALSLAAKSCSFLGDSRAEISKQTGAGFILQLSTGSGNVLLSEPFVFPCRTNTDQPGLLFITSGEEAIERELNLWLRNPIGRADLFLIQGDFPCIP